MAGFLRSHSFSLRLAARPRITHGRQEIDTAGDGFLATFTGPARAVRCACDIRYTVGDLGLEIRAGLHTGEVEQRHNSVAGLAVQGVGLGLFQLGYSDIVTAALPLRDRGVAGSLVLLALIAYCLRAKRHL